MLEFSHLSRIQANAESIFAEVGHLRDLDHRERRRGEFLKKLTKRNQIEKSKTLLLLSI